MAKISDLPTVSSLLSSAVFPLVQGGTTYKVDYNTLLTFESYVNELFVSKSGNDSNNGTNPQTPLLTINAAITAANALNPAIDNQVVITVLDAGEYTENLTQPDYTHILAKKAKLFGTANLGTDCRFEFFEVRATANNQDLIVKNASTGNSFVYIDQVDGTGAASGVSVGNGTATGVRCVFNNIGGGVLFVHIPKLFVGQGGEGIASSEVGFGNLHANIQDLYLAGNSALGIAANIVNASVILRFGHILEFGAVTGTTGIKLGSSGYVYAVGAEINCDTPYDVATNRNLRLVCPNIIGTPIGNAQVEFSNRRIICPDLPTDSTGLPSGALWNNSGVVNIVT